MKFKANTSILLAAALAGLLPLAASGAVTTSANASDLILGFRASGGTGQDTAYLVNIGDYSVFAAVAPGATYTLDLGNIAADLSATYDAGWASRDDLYWGIVGTN